MSIKHIEINILISSQYKKIKDHIKILIYKDPSNQDIFFKLAIKPGNMKDKKNFNNK